MRTPSPHLPKIATILLELTGTSIADLARQAELHRPNLVSWLGGKEHVLALSKQLKACETLGWRDGRLQRSRIHRWQVGNNVEMLNTALRELEPESTRFGFMPTHGSNSANGGILVSLSDESTAPLTVLIARPASPDLISPLSQGLTPTIIVSKTSVQMSAADWAIWWEDLKNHDAKALLQSTAAYAWAELSAHLETKPQAPSANTHQSLDDSERAWLDMLKQAKAAGIEIDLLKSKVKNWIEKK